MDVESTPDSPDISPLSGDSSIQWKSISLTHVEYPKVWYILPEEMSKVQLPATLMYKLCIIVTCDLLGFFLAWASLLPFCIIVGFITLIIFRRDLHTVSYFAGLLLNEAINWVLKHLIQAPRPVRNRQLYTEYGMPSSHAQFSWFFSTYMILFLFLRIYRNYNLIDDIWKYCVSAICVTGSSIILYSRVYLGYHTFGQVSCGALLGIFFGAAWFFIVYVVLTPFFPILASSPIGEFLMLRDSTLIPHVMWFEYTSSRTEARGRQRKSRKSQ